MSRLYLLLDELTQGEITPALLQHVLKVFLVSHQGRSDEASIEISGVLLLSRKSLNSNHSDWKAYPLTLSAEFRQSFRLPSKWVSLIHQPARLPLHLAATSRVCSLAKTLVTGSTASR